MSIYCRLESCTFCAVFFLKGDAGSPGHPGPKGEPGESISTPGVTVSPTSVTVTENRTATFYCSAAGNPKPTVSWSKVSDSKMLKNHQDKLEVQNAQHRDSGKYVCSGTNVLGKDEKMVELFVEGEVLNITFSR